MNKPELISQVINHLDNAIADLGKAQMRGIKPEHKDLLIFTACRTIIHLRNTLLTNEGESNESN
jgi:hypothetical protein